MEFGLTGAMVQLFLLKWTTAPCLCFEEPLPEVVECPLSLVLSGRPPCKLSQEWRDDMDRANTLRLSLGGRATR